MREFLESIEVQRVSKRVSTKLEISEYLRRYANPILFDDVEGYPSFRIVGNLCASRRLIAKGLGVPENELTSAIASALEKPRCYEIVDKERAPFLENFKRNPELLECLPLLMYYRRMERFYTSATIVLARDPETGRQNASFHRMMYVGGNRFAIRLVPRDLYSFYRKNAEAGCDTPVAVVCGSHPSICLAAATSYPNLNELQLARAFHDFSCVSLAGIDVPTNSEVVMVGRILKDVRVEEGPFVDLTGTWDAIRQEPVLEVEELYMRRDPIWQVILPGGEEHRLLMGLPQEPRIYRAVQNITPEVRRVVLTPGGCNWLHAIVSIRKRVEGEGKNVGLAALAAHPSLKLVIVVDEDIDIYDPTSVEWAIATRLQPSKGVVIIPDTHGSTIDPSSGKMGLTGKWIIDATMPMDRKKEDFMKVQELEPQGSET
ncbi:MAG: UbiD family decarboxylase [Candidatus Bathyarchaeia archaeon]